MSRQGFIDCFMVMGIIAEDSYDLKIKKRILFFIPLIIGIVTLVWGDQSPAKHPANFYAPEGELKIAPLEKRIQGEDQIAYQRAKEDSNMSVTPPTHQH